MRSIALLVLCSSCSLVFPLEGYARRVDAGLADAGLPADANGGISPDGGAVAGDAGVVGSDDAGAAAVDAGPQWAVLVGGSWNEVWLARFDGAGVLEAIEDGPPLSAPWSGLAQLGSELVAINDTQVARAPIVNGRPGAWTFSNSTSRPNPKGGFVVTAFGALNPPGEVGDDLSVAPFLGAGLDSWRVGAMTSITWVEPSAVVGDTFVLILGGLSDVAGTTELTATIEVASLSAGPTVGAFQRTTSMPLPLRQPALTLADGRLYLCGGLATTLSADCFTAPVAPSGSVGGFEPLDTLPMAAERGTLLKVGQVLYLFGASTTGDTVYSLSLSTPGARWSRSPVRQPQAREVGRALLLRP